MQFKAFVAAALVSAASAQDLAAFESQVGDYLSSLQNDPNFIGSLAGLATVDPNLLASLEALTTPVTDAAQLATPPALLTALPSPYNQIIGSVYTHELSIASANGLLGSGAVASAGATATAAVSSAAGAAGSLLSSISNSASAVTASAASQASTATAATGTNSISTAGAALATNNAGVLAMGAVVGMIGGVAALL